MKTDRIRTIKAGWLLDGRGGAIQRDMVLELDRDRISRCVATKELDNGPPDLDLSDCMLIPGLVDCHVHLFMSGTADATIRKWQLNAPYERMRTVIETILSSIWPVGLRRCAMAETMPPMSCVTSIAGPAVYDRP